MADLGSVKTATMLGAVTVNLSTSSKYPMQRGPASFQSTVVATGTGTSVFNGICTINASNDNIGWHPIGTCTALGTLAAAGASTGTASDLFALANTNIPYRMTQAVCNTTATGAGITFQSTVTMGL